MRIYLASSWRNRYQPALVALLRAEGHEVYDFRNPAPGNTGFAWSAIDVNWLNWSPYSFRQALQDPIAAAGFKLDMDALRWCEACVCLLPCGRSAHLELGWAAGAGRHTIVYAPELPEPELMYLMTGGIALTEAELLAWLREKDEAKDKPRACRFCGVAPVRFSEGACSQCGEPHK